MLRSDIFTDITVALGNKYSSFLATNATDGHRPRRKKPCIQCSKMHRHNNSFCSAACCKLYRSNP